MAAFHEGDEAERAHDPWAEDSIRESGQGTETYPTREEAITEVEFDAFLRKAGTPDLDLEAAARGREG
jgi:hypothetical protein